MKKLTVPVIAAALTFNISAFAEADNSSITFKFAQNGTAEQYAALAVFSGNSLAGCGLYEIENKDDFSYVTVTGDMADTAAKAAKVKIVLFESGEIITDIESESEGEDTVPAVSAPAETVLPDSSPAPTADITPESSASPAVSAAPENTPVPTDTPRNTYNPVYPKEIDAVSAFAVVQNVKKAILNDETVYEIDALYQGEERIFYIDTDVTVKSSPDSLSSVTGGEMNVLKEGDVISVKAGLSGKIKDVVLVMRPPSKDIITSGSDYGNSFEHLYSRNYVPSAYSGDSAYIFGRGNSARVKYAFGVITDKNSSMITLRGADGKADSSLDVYFEKNTCVYAVDFGRRKDVSLESVSYLKKSAIPGSYFDDDDNITDWDADCDYVYALVRIVDDTATDITVISY